MNNFYSGLLNVSFWKNIGLKTEIKMIEQFKSVCKNTHLAVIKCLQFIVRGAFEHIMGNTSRALKCNAPQLFLKGYNRDLSHASIIPKYHYDNENIVLY